MTLRGPAEPTRREANIRNSKNMINIFIKKGAERDWPIMAWPCIREAHSMVSRVPAKGECVCGILVCWLRLKYCDRVYRFEKQFFGVLGVLQYDIVL